VPPLGDEPDQPTTGPLARLLIDSVVAESVREIDLPHVVVVHDPVTGTSSMQGPFPNGLAALVAADAEDPSMQVSVAPLLDVSDV
jgi:hypothetical protein